MSLFTSIFGKTASRSQNSKSQNSRNDSRSDRSAARRSVSLLDNVGRFEVSE